MSGELQIIRIIRRMGWSITNILGFTDSWELFDASGGLDWLSARNQSITQSLWEDDLANTKPTDQNLAFKPDSWVSQNYESIFVALRAWKKTTESNKGTSFAFELKHK